MEKSFLSFRLSTNTSLRSTRAEVPAPRVDFGLTSMLPVVTSGLEAPVGSMGRIREAVFPTTNPGDNLGTAY